MTQGAKAGVGLRLSGIGHDFGSLRVLDGIDLDIPRGEVTVLVGPSGCGKSTLLGIAGGLIAPSQGNVTQHGDPRPDCLNPLTYVFQDFALLPWRTVAGNISLVLEDSPLPRAERPARIAEMLSITGLSAFAAAWPRQLSGGMRQRVGIARALAVRPAVLLMDEPLSALDAQTRDLLLDEFVALIARSAATVLYVTHNLSEAVRLGTRIVVLSRRPGRIRAIVPVQGDPAALEARLWSLIRDDAAAAERELADV
jgi:NitT/TauT family transport system ATP-binding protein